MRVSLWEDKDTLVVFAVASVDNEALLQDVEDVEMYRRFETCRAESTLLGSRESRWLIYPALHDRIVHTV